MEWRWWSGGVWLGLLAAAACAGGQGRQDARCEPRPDAPLAYRLTLTRLGLRATVDVELAVQSPDGRPLPDPLALVVPHRWAGFDDLGDAIVDLRASDDAGHDLPLERQPGLAEVRHGGLGRLTVRYRIQPTARELDEGSRFHALGGPEIFFSYGRTALVRPRDLDERSTEAVLELAAEPRGSRWVTTLGGFDGATRLGPLPLSDWLDAAMLAGRPRLSGDASGPDPVVVAADPQLGPVDDAVCDTARRIGAYERALWGRPQGPGTVAILLRRRDAPDVATGSGRVGGFVLELGDAVDAASPEVAELIAHESLHRYLGMAVRFDVRTARQTQWFSEGVVSYLAAQAVVRSGLAPPDWLLGRISAVATGYLANPRRTSASSAAPGSEQDFWGSPAARSQPYELGFLLALGLDSELREAGGHLAGTVARWAQAWPEAEPIGPEALEDLLRSALGSEPATRLADYASGAQSLPLESWLGTVGLALHPVREAAAYYGVDTARGRDGIWWVVAVDPLGPAAGLALRAGDQLFEAPWQPAEGSGAAHFRVASVAGPRDVWVHPAAGERLEYRVVDAGAFCERMGLSGGR